MKAGVARSAVRLALLAVLVLCAGAAVAAGPAAASAEGGREFRTVAEAQAALDDAAATQRSLDKRYSEERARCSSVFFVTQCLDRARRNYAQGHARVHQIEVDAHDFQRRQAAQERESGRETQFARRQAESERHKETGQRSELSRKSAGDGGEAPDAAEALKKSQSSRERYQKRNADHDQEQTKRAEVMIRERSENLRRYQEKQTNAKAYAEERARQREENERSCAEREAERTKKFGPNTGAGQTPAPQ
jgi:colicin import membrane protein